MPTETLVQCLESTSHETWRSISLSLNILAIRLTTLWSQSTDFNTGPPRRDTCSTPIHAWEMLNGHRTNVWWLSTATHATYTYVDLANLLLENKSTHIIHFHVQVCSGASRTAPCKHQTLLRVVTWTRTCMLTLGFELGSSCLPSFAPLKALTLASTSKASYECLLSEYMYLILWGARANAMLRLAALLLRTTYYMTGQK